MSTQTTRALKKMMQTSSEVRDNFNYFVDQFEDMRVLKYKVPGFESLTLKQKKFTGEFTQNLFPSPC